MRVDCTFSSVQSCEMAPFPLCAGRGQEVTGECPTLMSEYIYQYATGLQVSLGHRAQSIEHRHTACRVVLRTFTAKWCSVGCAWQGHCSPWSPWHTGGPTLFVSVDTAVQEGEDNRYIKLVSTAKHFR